MSQPIRVLLAHSHPVVMLGLEKLINNEFSRMIVAGKATNKAEAKLVARATQPDILLLDLALALEDTVDLLPYLLEEGKFHIMVLCDHSDQAAIDKIVLKGARGVVHKEETVQTFVKAIQKVHEGELWLDRTTISRAFTNFCRANRRAPNESNSVSIKLRLLTEREREIVRTFAKAPGVSNKRIAQILEISEYTLRNQLPSVFRKLGLSNRFGLFVFSEQHYHLLDPTALHNKNLFPAGRQLPAITGERHSLR